MTKIRLVVLSGLACGLLLLVAVGCDGISGDRGGPGDPGPPGPDYSMPVPENRFFSLAVANNSLRSHNGAPKLYLSFDGAHQAAGDTVVSNRLIVKQVPGIDGVDDGTEGWGDAVSVVNLLRAAGNENSINTAQVRSAFDNEFVYFQVKWTEVEDAELDIVVAKNDNPDYWIYPASGTGDNTKKWSKSTTNEDRVNLFFEISPVTRYESDGCYVTCHTNKDTVATRANFHATRGSRERMDVWHWTAATSNHTGFALDRYMDNSGTNGVRNDLGTPIYRVNHEFSVVTVNGLPDTTSRPLYMGFNDPNSNSGYPLWDYQVTRMATAGWIPGSTVPGYVNSIPYGSTADIEAVGQYDTGTWTVEFKRKRFTGNGDDVRF